MQQTTTCPECRGEGVIIDHPCRACAGAGAGQIDREEALTVKIPAGAEEGLLLRIAGKGYASPAAGGEAGDLLIVVRSAPDPRLQRDGADLWQLAELDGTDALLGAELVVPGLDGQLTLRVPAGTQPDAQLRLRGKGLPRYGEAGHGDMFVRIAVRMPERLTREERKLWEQLRTVRGSG